MDVDLGGSARIPLHAFDADRLAFTPAEVAVYVKLPDATSVGPLSVTQNDLTRGWFPFTTTQPGQHRYRVVETATDVQVTEGAFYAWPSYTDLTTLWAPSLTEVAALVPTRTIDTTTGVQTNTFTTGTVPTASQVQGYITNIVAEISGVVGDIPSRLTGAAKHTAELGVAWLIERSYPPTSAVQNVANDFVNDYRASLRSLSVAAEGSGAAEGAQAVSVSLGAFTWPEA